MSRVLDNYIEETGVVKDFAGSTAPAGYLMCYGQAVSRDTYKNLFAVIGTTYGTGDGSTTFNVPDCRGRVPVGKDNMGGTAANRVTSAGGGIDAATLGAIGGTEAHTLTAAQMPTHYHGASIYDPTHGHGHNAAANVGGSSTGGGGFALNAQAGATINAAGTGVRVNSANGLDTTASAGSGGAHPNVQPGIVFNKIIKI